jgi:hypothetical protein
MAEKMTTNTDKLREYVDSAAQRAKELALIAMSMGRSEHNSEKYRVLKRIQIVTNSYRDQLEYIRKSL